MAGRKRGDVAANIKQLGHEVFDMGRGIHQQRRQAFFIQAIGLGPGRKQASVNLCIVPG